MVPLRSPSISTLGNKSSNGSLPATFVAPAPCEGTKLASSADVRVGSGAGLPSTLSNSLVIVLSSWGLRSSRKSLMPGIS